MTQSCAKILGKERAERVVKLDKSLLSSDSYLFKIAQLEEFIPGGFSGEENLLFYVGMDLGKNDEFEIGSTGHIEGHSRMLSTFPLFFLSPKMIREHARELKNTSMPVYFTTWLHEYCHFIGYCLQRRPVGAAYGILYAELLSDSHEGHSVRDIKKIMDTKKDEMSAKVAETIFYLHRLDEGMANFLQELLLEELGFNPAGGDVGNKLTYANFLRLQSFLFLDRINRINRIFWSFSLNGGRWYFCNFTRPDGT